jgi:transposase
MLEIRSRVPDCVRAATVLDLEYYPGRGEHRPTSRIRKLERKGHAMQTTATLTVWIGLDVSKDKLDACLIKIEGKPLWKIFPNSTAGHQKLLRWAKHSAGEAGCHFGLEATGAYGLEIAQFLADADEYISILNPARVKYEGIAGGQGNKTDAADAHTIAEYCRLHHPPLWKQALPEVRHLNALVRRLKSVVEMRVQEKNRQQLPGQTPVVLESILQTITFFDQEIARLQQQIDAHIDNTPSLKADRDLLTSIPGIGDIAAQQILAELPDVAQFKSAQSLAAFAGLAPREYRSGKSVHKRTKLTKAGNVRLRLAVYFPAVAAIRHNPFVKALYERLIAAGKPRMAALGAAMRKMLMLAYGVLKNRQKFDKDWKLVPLAGAEA